MNIRLPRQWAYFSLVMVIGSGCATESSDSPDSSHSSGKTFAMVFEGDSDIELWNTTAYPNAINLGVGGATCADVESEIGQMLVRYQPSKVVLVCGENDLFERNATQTFGFFENIVEAIHSAGAKVIYMGTKPEPLWDRSEPPQKHAALTGHILLARETNKWPGIEFGIKWTGRVWVAKSSPPIMATYINNPTNYRPTERCM